MQSARKASRQVAAVGGLVAAALLACARAPLPHASGLAFQLPPAAGDSTLALWHFDETTGLKFADSGPAHRDGVFGIDTRVAFGRFRNARQFVSSINSFGLVPASRAPQLGASWTIEAWINMAAYGPVECSVVAARWTDQPNEQSWMLGVAGKDWTVVPGAPTNPPALFDALITRPGQGLLVFAFQPEAAGEPRAFLSTVPISLDRWTHVAVTQNGQDLRIYIDGRLDSQYANAASIRDAAVPLVIGNQLDPRWLTESQGPLRVPDESDRYPFYAFEGAIDEVRISDVALSTGTEAK